MAFVPAYLEGGVMGGAERAALQRFVERGGVLVMTRPIGDATSSNALDLAGLTAARQRLDLDEVLFDGLACAPVSAFDSPEERQLLVTEESGEEPGRGLRVHARARRRRRGDRARRARRRRAGPAITRRALGRGAVYALGHDLFSFDHYRCYINCFEPGRDLLALFLEGALREASLGHVMLLHTVPGKEDSMMMLTHDVDAPDAQQRGSWGSRGRSRSRTSRSSTARSAPTT